MSNEKISKIEHMKDLVLILNKASYEYHVLDNPTISDKEYDCMFSELCLLEVELEISMSDSPTQRVGEAPIQNIGDVILHDKPMLSCNKTKSKHDIQQFVGMKDVLVSWKLDGGTVVLTYDGGMLIKAVTRGNGIVGEDITEQVKLTQNIPLFIPVDNKVVLRGEAVMSWGDFERVNNSIDDDKKYKHPRNLSVGTLRQLDKSIIRERNINILIFEAVDGIGGKTKEEQFKSIQELGFDVVPHVKYTRFNSFADLIKYFEPNKFKFPADGIVFDYNNVEYAKSLGATKRWENCRIALKWSDEVAQTRLLDIEWYTSKTGLINPVAIFEPVEIEGATISRATLCNVSTIKKLKIGIGDTIEVYRANKVIPKIYKNLTQSDTYEIPTVCPMCGEKVEVHETDRVRTLHCVNAISCKSKIIDKILYFASKSAMNIKGLGVASIESFVDMGILNTIEDVYDMDNWYKNKDKIIELSGWSEKSFNTLMKNVVDSQKSTLDRFLTSLSIPFLGAGLCRDIAIYFDNDYEKIKTAFYSDFDWKSLPRIGEISTSSLKRFLSDNIKMVESIASKIEFQTPKVSDKNSKIKGKTFTITGFLQYSSREELIEAIKANGGIVKGSVTKDNDYLIINNKLSGKTKAVLARKYGVPMISEIDILDMMKI